MPHYIGPNRKIRIVTRKIFEDFNRCDDDRAWQAACTEQPNDSWREICVYLRQWLLKNGATEEDGHVILAISW